ncbi:MAG: hypothetical protein A2X94_04775 [Bdellovibrionales bacterium GWB1_55_8]|nr:MAG: hypothetical protein A2X94_04775 [Bdellovibrionales bacterium GWB1_55_8]
MRKYFAIQKLPVQLDWILVITRVVIGITFMMIGSGKIQNPFQWMGADATVPALFQALAAISEFGGGLALILGLLTRLGALGITFTMVGAIIFHLNMGDPYIHAGGGRSYQLATAYLLIALLVLLAGPGRFSLDRNIFGTRT